MELCLVLLFCSSIFGSMSRYWVLSWTVNCFNILVLIVRFHLSQTLNFSLFSLEYSVISFVSNSSLIFFVIILFPFISPKILWFTALLEDGFECFRDSFPFFYPSMPGQSNHIWRTDLTALEGICNPCSIC